MNCAYDLCLYNKDFECILDKVSIDSLGHCEDCIILNIDKETLEAEKEHQLNKMEKERNQQANNVL